MAPEQIDHPSDVDHRADIYALGVVLYQMLTGELPDKDLQAPSRKVHIDVRLDEIVLRAMEKQPDLRYQTAREFRTIVDGFQEQAQPPSLPILKPKRGILRRWWWVFLIMFPVGLLIGIAAGSVLAYVFPKKYEAQTVIEFRPVADSVMTPSFFASQFEAIISQDSLVAVAGELDLPNQWMLSQEAVIQRLKSIITTENIRGTDLITIRVRHTDRQEVAAIVKALAQNYQRVAPGEVVIHEEPSEPQTPASPNVVLIIVLGGLLGIMLSPLLALILITILQRLFPETNSSLQPDKTRLTNIEASSGGLSQEEQKSPALKRRLTTIMTLTLGSSVLGLISHAIWLLLGHKDPFFPTIFVSGLFGTGLIAIASRPGPKRFRNSAAAVCTVLATLGFIVHVHRGGVSYPASSMSSSYKAPVLGRIKFDFTHPESPGEMGTGVGYDVKKWGDTQWKPSSGMQITLQGENSLLVKSRVNAMGGDAPIAMITTSSNRANWETKEWKIDGKSPPQDMVFSNGLRVKIKWTAADLSKDHSKAPNDTQQQIMLQASRESDRMHPISQPLTIEVVGEVNIKGTTTWQESTSLLDTVAAAGGWTKKADLEKVRITIPGTNQKEIYNLNSILNGYSINPPIAPNSIIDIPIK